MTQPDETALFDPRHLRDHRSATSVAAAQTRRPGPPPPPVMPHQIRQRIVPMSGLAAASFALGVLAYLTFGVTALPAVITGHKAMRHTRDGYQGGHGLAVVGALLGWLAVAGWLLFWLFLFAGVLGSLRGVQ